MPEVVSAIGWYEESQWPEYVRLMVDNKEPSYADWRQKALALEEEMKGQGLQVRRVPVDLSEFELWCKVRKRRRDAHARSEFVTQQIKGRT